MVVRPAVFAALSQGEFEAPSCRSLRGVDWSNVTGTMGFWMSMNTYKDTQELDRIWGGATRPGNAGRKEVLMGPTGAVDGSW